MGNNTGKENLSEEWEDVAADLDAKRERVQSSHPTAKQEQIRNIRLELKQEQARVRAKSVAREESCIYSSGGWGSDDGAGGGGGGESVLLTETERSSLRYLLLDRYLRPGEACLKRYSDRLLSITACMPVRLRRRRMRAVRSMEDAFAKIHSHMTNIYNLHREQIELGVILSEDEHTRLLVFLRVLGRLNAGVAAREKEKESRRNSIHNHSHRCRTIPTLMTHVYARKCSGVACA